MANRQGSIRTKPTVEDHVVYMTFVKGSGEDEVKLDQAAFNLDELPPETYRQMAEYGVRKALMDRTSDMSKPMQDQGDPRVKIDAMRELWEMFKAGQWEKPRAGGGGGGVPLVVEAIARLKNLSIGQAKKAWDSQTDEQKDALKASEKVREAMEEIRAERAKEAEQEVSFDDLLE